MGKPEPPGSRGRKVQRTPVPGAAARPGFVTRLKLCSEVSSSSHRTGTNSPQCCQSHRIVMKIQRHISFKKDFQICKTYIKRYNRDAITFGTKNGSAGQGDNGEDGIKTDQTSHGRPQGSRRAPTPQTKDARLNVGRSSGPGSQPQCFSHFPPHRGSNLVASPGHDGRTVLGLTQNTLTLTTADELKQRSRENLLTL